MTTVDPRTLNRRTLDRPLLAARQAAFGRATAEELRPPACAAAELERALVWR